MLLGSYSQGATKDAPAQRFQALVWWSDAQLRQLSSPLHTAWTDWARGWLPGAPPQGAGVECAMACERAGGADVRWQPLGARGAAAAWIDAGSGTPAVLARVLFGKDQPVGLEAMGPPAIAEAVAAQSRTDLHGQLRAALQLDEDADQRQPEPSLFKPWSGAVVAQLLEISGMGVSLLLNAACAEALVRHAGGRGTAQSRVHPSTAKPESIEIALAPRRVALHIELNGCELELGSLQDLRVGDIVTLPHSLESPLEVNLDRGPAICAGFLGRQGGLKAIELVRSLHPSGVAAQSHHQQSNNHEL